jgi:hypothetical protein
MSTVRENARHLQVVPCSTGPLDEHAPHIPNTAVIGLESALATAQALATLSGRSDVASDLAILRRRISIGRSLRRRPVCV